MPTISTYVTMRKLSQSDIQYRPYLHILPMRRLSQSDIQYRPYLHMLPREDSINQIYNTEPICICYQEKTQSIRYTDPIYMCYHEKTQSIRYTIPTLSTYITHEKTQSIRYTIPTLSTYVTMRRLSRSDIQHRHYLYMLPKEDSVNQIYNTDPIYICYSGMTQPIRCTIPTISTYVTVRRLSRSGR